MKAMHSFVVAGALGLVGLGGLISLVPSDSDYVELMLRDGATARAQDMNEGMLAAAPDKPELLYRAYQLRAGVGDVEGATQSAVQLVRATQGDITAVRLLAQHYLHIGAVQERLDLYNAVEPTALTDDEREQMLAGFRYEGRYSDERRALVRMAVSGVLDTAQSGRLGMVLASAGEGQTAIIHLAAFDDDSQDAGIYRRLTLLHLLLKYSNIDEAKRRATRWQTLWGDGDAMLSVGDAFEAAGHSWP